MIAELHDGRKLEFPDGTDPAIVQATVRRVLGLDQPTSAPAPLARGDSIGKGLRDPIDGGAQLLTKMLPEGVVKAGDQFNNWLADKTGLVGRLPEGGVDQQVRQQEAAYQASRKAGGEDGIDWGRLTGNIFNPATIGTGAASMAPAAIGAAGRIGLGAVGGAANAALAPVTEGDFADAKTQQIGLGALFGGGASAGANALSRLISPNASLNPGMRLLQKEGVKPSIGQTLGGWAQNFEDKAKSVPIIGNMIDKAQTRGVETLNTAAYNRALRPIGESLPASMLGRNAVEYVEGQLGKRYDDLLPKMTTQMDGQFITEVQKLRNMMGEGAIDPAAAAQFEQMLQSKVLGKFRGETPTLTGETLKDVQRELTRLAGQFLRDPSADKQMLGEALGEVRKSVMSMAARANPDHAKSLKAIDTGYANFKRVQRAAAGLGAEEGVFTAAQLQNAVKAADKSKDKGQFARGGALMQDLSEAGKTIMSPSVPDSGTPGRLLLAGSVPAILAAIKAAPMTTAVAALTPLAYTKAGQNLLRSVVSARPELAKPVAEALRKTSPAIGTGLGLIGASGLEQ